MSLWAKSKFRRRRTMHIPTWEMGISECEVDRFCQETFHHFCSSKNHYKMLKDWLWSQNTFLDISFLRRCSQHWMHFLGQWKRSIGGGWSLYFILDFLRMRWDLTHVNWESLNVKWINHVKKRSNTFVLQRATTQLWRSGSISEAHSLRAAQKVLTTLNAFPWQSIF